MAIQGETENCSNLEDDSYRMNEDYMDSVVRNTNKLNPNHPDVPFNSFRKMGNSETNS